MLLMDIIKFVVFDFDGVFTDGKCYFDSNNNILKYYNVKDGMGLKILRDNNIKTGLISSYSTDKNIIFKNNEDIITHLRFDYKHIGNSDKKITILEKWIEELEINFTNVAYIGDDINDLDIIEKVGFSACPIDSIDQCKYKVNYICKKKGGEGCVREFIDYLIENKVNNNIIQEIRKEINYQLDNFDLEKINQIAYKITNCSGIIYTTGIGKSQNIAYQLSDLLKSISIKSFYLNPTNSTHGDIGTICSSDIIILISKSGKTNELANIIPYLKQRKSTIIGICNDKNNLFESECDYTIVLPLLSEITGNVNNIPSNSLISHQLFVNILINKLKNFISLDNYKQNHPAGSIGNNLKKISDCLIIEFPKILLKDQVKLYDILLEMTQYKIGCCFFVDEFDELKGILTDGDIRRLLIDNENLKEINLNLINKIFYWEDNLNKYILECKKYNYIPILCEKKIIGIINNFN
jgi:YrbI family 3-deoxy-D-manno-octulosonate 8-phosphate phosphatase